MGFLSGRPHPGGRALGDTRDVLKREVTDSDRVYSLSYGSSINVSRLESVGPVAGIAAEITEGNAMSRQDRVDPPTAGASAPCGAEGRDGPEHPSRRTLLRSAAGAGAAGVAATALSGLGGTALAAPITTGSAGHETGQRAVGADQADQFVVHVKDARAGEIDVFRGSSLTRLRDPDLTARLVRASRP
jgi:hypothetical protein